MNLKEFETHVEETFQSIRTLSLTKGKEYTKETEDRLENFKSEAEAIGLKPLHIFSVYASKHWRAIQSYIRNGVESSTESIESRFDDLILYCLLGKALVKEQKLQGKLEEVTKELQPLAEPETVSLQQLP